MTSPSLDRTLDDLQSRALEALQALSDDEGLEGWRVHYMGRKGSLTTLLRGLRDLPESERPAVGARANAVKNALEEALSQAQARIRESRLLGLAEGERIDVTRPGRPVALGRYHPLTQILREICDTFVSMGFQVVEGPEVEWDHYNFELLNIPRDHPARDMWNTLWIDNKDQEDGQSMLLRTHTSPMQARTMEKAKGAPVRVIVPGKCYRYEATDATHEWHFYQVEGLAVDEGITFANLKGTLYEFARRIFGPERKVRFRCDYFPFVEPGVDMSIDCFACDGGGTDCRICKETGWIEILGAGMVHPRVLEGVGYDPARYTGFAFGLGPERIAMLKYGIEDIRLFYSNDLRFLRQF
jgi:phenylalanyl-tRNA synthetase alpha chain